MLNLSFLLRFDSDIAVRLRVLLLFSLNFFKMEKWVLVVEVGVDQTGGGGVEDPHVLR